MSYDEDKQLPPSMVVNRYDASLDMHVYDYGEAGQVRIDNKVVHVLANKAVRDPRSAILAIANVLHSETKDLVAKREQRHEAEYKKLETLTRPSMLPHEAEPEVAILVDEYGFERVHREKPLGHTIRYPLPTGVGYRKPGLECIDFEMNNRDRRTVDGVTQNVIIYTQVTSAPKRVPSLVLEGLQVDEVAFSLFKTDPEVVKFVRKVSEVRTGPTTSFQDGVKLAQENAAKMKPFFERAWARGHVPDRSKPVGIPEEEWRRRATQRAHEVIHALNQTR